MIAAAVPLAAALAAAAGAAAPLGPADVRVPAGDVALEEDPGAAEQRETEHGEQVPCHWGLRS